MTDGEEQRQETLGEMYHSGGVQNVKGRAFYNVKREMLYEVRDIRLHPTCLDDTRVFGGEYDSQHGIWDSSRELDILMYLRNDKHIRPSELRKFIEELDSDANRRRIEVVAG